MWLDPNEVNDISMANSSERRQPQGLAAAASRRRPCSTRQEPVCTLLTNQQQHVWIVCQASRGMQQRAAPCGSDPCRGAVCSSCLPVAGQNVRKLVKDGFIIRKPQKIHSRSRARASAEAKSKGRHTGYGEQTGIRMEQAQRFIGSKTELCQLV